MMIHDESKDKTQTKILKRLALCDRVAIYDQHADLRRLYLQFFQSWKG